MLGLLLRQRSTETRVEINLELMTLASSSRDKAGQLMMKTGLLLERIMVE
jgi:hypothetical protein